jgi:dCMP deaminase
MTKRWDDYFLDLALATARMSKDPDTQVGAVIVGPDREVLSSGFNGLPRGIRDTALRLYDKEEKLSLVIHGEMNAILNAARNGTRLRGTTLYFVATDSSGAIWGGPPCVRCAVEIIQAGIAEVASLPFKEGPSKWRASTEKAREVLTEAGVAIRELER